jgi:mannose-6-phosphate isomerase-like protein (cupin superfamily)
MRVVNIEHAEHYTWGSACDGWRLLNNPDLAVTQERIPPGLGEVKHYHARSRQLFYVLQGRLQIIADETIGELATGDSVEIPPGQTHSVRNPFDADAHFLVISAPSTANDRVNL